MEIKGEEGGSIEWAKEDLKKGRKERKEKKRKEKKRTGKMPWSQKGKGMRGLCLGQGREESIAMISKRRILVLAALVKSIDLDSNC